MKYAHKSDDGRKQTIKEHLEQTARLAENNAVGIFKPFAYDAGLAHDVGKYADAFQKRLDGSTEKYEHSACGAIEYKELLDIQKNKPSKEELIDKMFAPMMEFCIACHHTGLQDGGNTAEANQNIGDGTMNVRISSKRKADYTGDRDYSDYKKEIMIIKPDFKVLFDLLSREKTPKDRIELYAFFTRYIFSCLVDADFIDTERFCQPDLSRGLTADFDAAYENLEKKFASYKNVTELQRSRSRIQRQAYENNDKKASVSILNMPTGSGKTLCSLKLALNMLRSDNTKKRIIYVIPYTGIIDQTAGEFEKIFNGSVRILQHHSNYSPEKNNEDISTADKLRLACENWDAPFIITTAVQFFQSFYECRTSALRKVHNMADSIIVFDEIHTLPVEVLQPCLRAVGYITRFLNSKAIFLSATMPDYSKLFEKYAPECKITHLIRNTSDFDYFKKAEYVNLGKTDFEAVAEKASLCGSSLIIVNSRRSAKNVYDLLEGNKYHLSTYMTPYDRRRIIAKIKNDLNNNVKTTVVSTSLIEAGIDLDFEMVFREINGLDNILQAGGRCNREGLRDKGTVYIFETDSSFPKGKTDIRINAAKRLTEKYKDISAPECIVEYYNEIFYFNKETIEKNSIAADTYSPAEINFRTYAEKFKLIDDDTIGVVVPQNDECLRFIKMLETGEGDRRTVIRRLQSYSAPLKCRGENSEYNKARDTGIIRETEYGITLLTDMKFYDEETGLDVEKSNDVFVI